MNDTENKAPSIPAVFHPQAYVNDYAVDIDGKVQFDATDAFLDQGKSGIRMFKFNSHASDHLAVNLPARRRHIGPFEVDVSENDLNKFFAYYGVSNWRKISATALCAIIKARRKLKVQPAPAGKQKLLQLPDAILEIGERVLQARSVVPPDDPALHRAQEDLSHLFDAYCHVRRRLQNVMDILQESPDLPGRVLHELRDL